MDKDKLRPQLIRHEGEKFSAYQDSLGYWTIGVGRLIDARKGGKISHEEAMILLDNDIEEKCKELDAHLPWWKNLDDVRQRVLVNMCFNMGIGGLLQFKNTLAHMEKGEYQDASVGMLDSTWAKQVGNRAIELAQMMKDGA